MKKEGSNVPGKKESRLEKVIVTLLVVLVSLLSFSVGVISGKGLSDKEYALKSIDKKYSHAMNEDTEAQEAAGSGELSEEEIQALAKSALENAEHEGATEKVAAAGEHADPAAAHTDEPHDSSAKAHGKKEVAKVEREAVATEDDRSPSSVANKAAAAEYTVQVASYADAKEAENMAGNLIKKGYPAFPFKTEINGKTWYRVSVGTFKNKKEAMTYQAEITKQGVIKDSIVQKLTR